MHYSLIDDDILILTDTLKMERHQLNILSSSKLEMFYIHSKSENQQIRLFLEFNKGKNSNYF